MFCAFISVSIDSPVTGVRSCGQPASVRLPQFIKARSSKKKKLENAAVVESPCTLSRILWISVLSRDFQISPVAVYVAILTVFLVCIKYAYRI